MLTAFAVALAALFIGKYGRDGLIIYFSNLPVALALLWTSTGATRFDERGADPSGHSPAMYV